MSASSTPSSVPWWKEPTRGSVVHACIAVARLDARRVRLHDFPVDHATDLSRFGVPLTAVAIVFTLTLWLRLLGATAAVGWGS